MGHIFNVKFAQKLLKSMKHWKETGITNLWSVNLAPLVSFVDE